MSDKFDQLRQAGFVLKAPLPEVYKVAIEAASDEEITALISLKARLDEAQASTDAPPYHVFMVPPF